MKTRPSSRLRWWLAGLVVVLAAAAIGFARWGEFDWKELTATIASLNPVIVLVLMAVLPLGGFSVTVVYLVAGAKFGPVLGGVAVAGATAVHLLGSYAIGQTMLRAPLQRYLKRKHHELPHVPEGEEASVAVMAALVPGLPYFARNYLLALTEVPLRLYFLVCLPLYVARSYVAILLGDLGADPDGQTLAILAAVYVVKLSICAYLIWRIRRRWKASKGRGRANEAGRAGSVSG